jgi:hypothetical protein
MEKQMRMTDILECQKLNICIQLSVPNKHNLLHNEISLFYFWKKVTFLECVKDLDSIINSIIN